MGMVKVVTDHVLKPIYQTVPKQQGHERGFKVGCCAWRQAVLSRIKPH